MSVILFILVLVALIVVHEFGHFLVAKWSGMRVDEFGLGYPPRALTFLKKGETEYTLNWLPFGGFVRIYGEDEAAVAQDPKDGHRAFFARPRILQALTLVAGILMNLLFAWLLISLTLAIGAPRALTMEEAAAVPDAALTITGVTPGTPASEAGFKAGDRILHALGESGEFSGIDPDAFTTYMGSQTPGEPVTFEVRRGDATETIVATPQAGLVEGAPERAALGVTIATVGTVHTPWWMAPIEGAKVTWDATAATAAGLFHFFAGLATFSANLSQVSGPVGIAGAVGDASESGIAELLTLTAIISINLALINLIPIPALDGGRLLFVIIESITRRPIPSGVARSMNTIGFALLLLLMVVVTASDIFKIAG